MDSAFPRLLQAHVPGHVARWEELAASGLRAMFWDHGDDWCVYVALGDGALAYTTVDPARDTVRLVRTEAVLGTALVDEPDGTSFSFHVAAPVGVLTLRATSDAGRHQLRELHRALLARLR